MAKEPTNRGQSSRVIVKKGYIPAERPGKVQGGYQGPTGQQGTPPTGGSSVKPPAKKP